MTNLQSNLQCACQELGLSIVMPFLLKVHPSIQINAQALLPQLGALNGMIIVNHHDELRGVESELLSMGYGYSVLDEPLLLEDYDLESYMEMFLDWGWGNINERKPNWMK